MRGFLIIPLVAMIGCSFGETTSVSHYEKTVSPSPAHGDFQFVQFGSWSNANRMELPVSLNEDIVFRGPARGVALDVSGAMTLSGTAELLISANLQSRLILDFDGYYRIDYNQANGMMVVGSNGAKSHILPEGLAPVNMNRDFRFYGNGGPIPDEVKGLLSFTRTGVNIFAEFLGRR